MKSTHNLIHFFKRASKLNDRGITFIDGDDTEDYCSYQQVYDEALKYLYCFQTGGMQPGDEIVLQLEDNKIFISVFWACILGGLVPVPVSVGNNDEHRMKLFKVWRTLNNPYLVTNKGVINNLKKFAANHKLEMLADEMFNRFWDTDDIDLSRELGQIHEVMEDTLAFIQFSSGSTGDPKGVMLTHGNLVANINGIIKALEITEEDRYLSWMPLTHDMGLIANHLTSLVKNINQYIMPTALFIRRPSLWMKKTSEHRATILASPNFGYKFLLTYQKSKKMDNWDLSTVRVILNGAEPISTEICELFLNEMSKYGLKRTAMETVYGLAEASVGVAVPAVKELYKSIYVDRNYLGIGEKVIEVQQTLPGSCSFVEVGVAIPGSEFRICDENNRIVPDRTIGIIQIRGTNVTSGYYNNPEATQKVKTADGWINTGDLGFMRDESLVCTGRLKDMIINNGQNIYPHDIERVAEEIEGVELGKVAVSGIKHPESDSESIVVFVASRLQPEQFAPLAVKLKAHLNERGGWETSDIIPIRKIPKTTSGKVQRYVLSEQYINGEYKALSDELAKSIKEYINSRKRRDPRTELEGVILKICREVLKSEDMDVHDRFMEIGLNSLQMVQITEQIEISLDKKLNITDMFSYPTISELAGYLSNLDAVSAKITKIVQEKRKSKDIAIIGMHGTFPKADNLDEYWSKLMSGEDCVGPLDKERATDAGHFIRNINLSGRDTQLIEGGYLNEIDKFDYSFFKLTPKEASLMDPNQRLFLQTLWNTIEHAGYNGEELKRCKVGVYVGYSRSAYDYDRLLSELVPEQLPNYVLGNLPSIIASRISYLLDLRGPAIMVDTACSSSLVAVHMACKAILNGECEMALAGGVKTILLPVKAGIGMESSDGKARVFDDASDGTGSGEGVAAVMLKSLDQAVADGDHVIAVIKGSAVNQDGSTAGISAPSAAAQAELIQDAWNDAQVDPSTITYIESHGTGTKLGDPIEIEGIKRAFAQTTDRRQFCAIGSVKANIGHLYEAAGIAGLIKTVLSLQHKQIPPLLHFKTPNRNISFEDSPVYINRRAAEWESPDQARRAGVSSFGFSGTNCHVTLEEFVGAQDLKADHPVHVLTISAKSKIVLEKLANEYLSVLENIDDDSLQSVCYTANTGRVHHRCRLALVAEDRMGVVCKLKEIISAGNLKVDSDYAEPSSEGGYLAQRFAESGNRDLSCAGQLAKAYIRGDSIDWNVLYSHRKHYKFPLPVYPFERKRCWISSDINADHIREEGEPNMEYLSSKLDDAIQYESHEQELIHTLKSIIGKITHYSEDEIDKNTHFLELGFDSIILMQLKNAIKDSMDVDIPVQELFDSINNVQSLAKHLSRIIPAGKLNKTSSSILTAASVIKEEEPRVHPDGHLRNNPGTLDNGEDRDGQIQIGVSANPEFAAERIVERQIELMSKQLEYMQLSLLGKQKINSSFKQVQPQSQSDIHKSISMSLTEAAPALDTVKNIQRSQSPQKMKGEEAAFVPFKQNQLHSSHIMSSKQEEHVKKLIDHYTSRTQKTKDQTQKYRDVYANNRNIAGFRAHLKEMVYQTIAVKADGSKLWDVDGNEYVDLTMGFGVNLFGHNPKFIKESIEKELNNGMPLGPMSDKAGLLADRIRQLTGVERVAYYNSGTEAVMVSLRLARAATGRSKVVLFSGSYHGTFDGVLALGGVTNRSTPLAPGVLQSSIEDVVVLNYGTEGSLDYIREHAEQLAAVLVEPVQSRRPDYRPQSFLHELRIITENAGTALIFDEVITGFRMHQGGAQAMLNVRADLVTYGKVIGGGLPIGIVAGTARFMDGIDGGMWQYGDASYPTNENRRTFVAGTFCHHPLAMAASMAVVDKLAEEGEALQHNLNHRTAKMASHLNEWFQNENVPIKVVYCGSLFRFAFKGDLELFYYHMLDKGVYIWEGRNCFLSTAHTEEDINKVVQAVKESVFELRKGGFIPEPPNGGGGIHAISFTENKNAFPLTQDQQKLWLASKLSPNTSQAFQENVILTFSGSLNTYAFSEAVRQVVNRHEALRIRIMEDGESQYAVTEVMEVEIPMTDWSGEAIKRTEEEKQQWLEQACLLPLDTLSYEPLFRIQLLKYAQGKYVALFSFHHLIIDGWSIGLFFKELSALYSSMLNNEIPLLMEPVPFRRYVEQQIGTYADSKRNETILHWKNRFFMKWPAVSLSDSSNTSSFSGMRKSVLLERHITEKWKQISINHRSSLFTTMLTCFQILIHRHTSQQRITIGIPYAGQSGIDALNMMGNCVHMFPVCSYMNENTTFTSFLRQTKEWMAGNEQLQSYSLSELSEVLFHSEIEIPELNIVFNLDKVPGSIRFAGLDSELQPGGIRYAKYDLFLNVTENEGRLNLDFDYRTSVLSSEVIEELSQELIKIFETSMSQTDIPMDIRFIPPQAQLTTVHDISLSPGYESNSDHTGMKPHEKTMLNIWSSILGRQDFGIDDSFFDIGGTSMKALLLVSRLNQHFNAKLRVHDLFHFQTIRGLLSIISNEVDNRQDNRIQPVPVQEMYPVSSSQKRMFVMNQLNHSTAYNISGKLRIEGELDKDRLIECLQTIIQRHESLRTSFVMSNGELFQVIHPKIELQVLQQVITEGDLEEVSRLFVQPFLLEQAPLIRAELLTINVDNHVLLVDIPHIAADGLSLAIIMEELFELYKGNSLPDLTIHYKDYVGWQSSTQMKDKLELGKQFWTQQFTEEIPALDLPMDYLRPVQQTFTGHTIRVALNKQTTEELKSVSSQTGTTIFMVLLAAYQVLLHKYTGQDKMVVGTPALGRNHADCERMIGMFVNTLPLKQHVNPNLTFREFLSSVRETSLQAYEHQDYPLELLLNELSIVRDTSRNPLFDTVFAWLEAGIQPLVEGKMKWTPTEFNACTSKFDLTINAMMLSDTITLDFEYNTDLFNEERIARLSKHYSNIVRAAVGDLDQSLTQLQMLGEEERNVLLQDFNNTEVSYDHNLTLQQLFEAQALETPEAVALIAGEQSLTYAELNYKANQLAFTLREKGVGPDSKVGLLVDRKAELLISIWAVLKAGGAYLPIDPGYPAARIAYMLEDSGSQWLLTEKVIDMDLTFAGTVIYVDDNSSYTGDGINLQVINESCHLAYIIYTSGSTGTPKGVMLEHRSVHNFIVGMRENIPFRTEQTVLCLTTVSFDIFVLETLLPMTLGMRVVLASNLDQQDPHAIWQLVMKHKVQLLQATPSRLGLLMRDTMCKAGIAQLECIVVGGEPLNKEIVTELDQYGEVQLFNVYGPTETTVWSTVGLPISNQVIDIGKPIANTQIYIINDKEELQPIGITGELCIAGDGLARKYHQQSELTALNFVANPFVPGTRMYRTGDLARWSSDGTIILSGRKDNQVKIRGYRVDTGEIESQLLKHRDVLEAVVVGRRLDNEHTNTLCAYVSIDLTNNSILSNHSHHQIVGLFRKHLSEQLPAYMLPSYFVFTEKLPQTPNGKIDRKALPEPERDGGFRETYVLPRDEKEKIIARAWEQSLSVGSVGIYDDFFALGGDSIKALKVVSILKDNHYEIDISSLFNYSTIELLSPFVSVESPPTNSDKLVEDKNIENNLAAADWDELQNFYERN